jgi:hypothetical protein
MPYADNFTHADDIVVHLNTVVPSLADPLLQAKYVGFVAIAAVTVYELAVKEIFVTFGTKKHRTFGAFTESFFRRINGRIKIPALKDDYIVRFGERYKKRFETKLQARAVAYLVRTRRDIMSSYHNIITWRNDFAHEGRIRTTATYSDVVQAYEDGKEVIHCLSETMTR